MPVRSLNFAKPTASVVTYEELLKIGAEAHPLVCVSTGG